jgi:hypothetical protein
MEDDPYWVILHLLKKESKVSVEITRLISFIWYNYFLITIRQRDDLRDGRESDERTCFKQ